jgi:hypothetical protein
MRRTNPQNYRFVCLLGKVVLPLCFIAEGAVSTQGQTETSKGTVNIALANANGIVLLTDSVQSHMEADGWHHLQPAQKLFRLDEKTVCSIAGFASETGWVSPELNTEVSGIIAEVRDQLSQYPVPELDAKLRAVGLLVGFYIDLVANRHEVLVGPGMPNNAYIFEVIVAGYDADGKPGLKKLTLTPTVIRAADGHSYWSHETSLEEPSLERGLTYLLGGIKDVSLQVLRSPQGFTSSAIIQKYARSDKESDGKSLTLNELASLASEMAAQKARKSAFVGGPDQIAFLAEGRVLRVDQPPFRDPRRPMRFALMVGQTVHRADTFMAGPDYHPVWIRSKFVGVENPRLRLDNQLFYGCEIRDSIVEYGGGLTDFGPTNTVINSMIVPAYTVVSTTKMLQIMNGFKWSLEPPKTAAPPPAVSPR